MNSFDTEVSPQVNRGRITIYDVAERAGVSISTVSLAINSPHRVREDTRGRVIAAAGALGYRSGATANGANAGVRVAVAAPFSSYPSYFRRFAGMLADVRNTAVELTVHDLGSAAAAASPLLDALPARRGVDGLIVMGVPLGSAALRASRDAAVPLVFVDVQRARTSRSDVPTVLVDDREGGRLVGTHLGSLGHTRTVFLHEPQASGAYVSAGMLRAAGLAESVDIVDAPVPSDRALAETLESTLRGRRGTPTAIVANHDDLAARACRVLAAFGVRIPDDVAVVGFDDGPLAAALDLTTVAQPFEETGRAALGLVLGEISGTSRSVRRIVLQPSLVVRGST